MFLKNTNVLVPTPETLIQRIICGIPASENFTKFFMWFWHATRFQNAYIIKIAFALKQLSILKGRQYHYLGKEKQTSPSAGGPQV